MVCGYNLVFKEESSSGSSESGTGWKEEVLIRTKSWPGQLDFGG